MQTEPQPSPQTEHPDTTPSTASVPTDRIDDPHARDAARPDQQPQNPQPERERLRRRVAELERTIADKDSMLREHSLSIGIERTLAAAGAVDLEAAAILVRAQLRRRDKATPNHPQPSDVESAVAELRNTRPYLFRSPFTPTPNAPQLRAAAMAPTPSQDLGLDAAAQDAAASGDRHALLRYLRLRRNA